MNQLDHPNVVRLLEIYDEEHSINLVMELMQGGELFDRIVEKESYSEKMASDTIQPIVDAIRYCHELGIVHRDLKPENLLYETDDEKSVIKISDFGLARFVEGDFATTACGTPGYLAPEIIEGKGYGQEVDYWSIGIILYVMLCGFPPFYNENNQALFKSIQDVDYEFPSPYWDDISEAAKDLVRKLLVKDPKQRLTAVQILEHPWIKNQDVASNTQNKSIPIQLKEYQAKRRFKMAGNVVIATNKFMKIVDHKKKE